MNEFESGGHDRPEGRLLTIFTGAALSLMLALLPVTALCADSSDKQEDRAEAKAAKASEKKHKQKKPSRRLRPFTPSERIGADQAVAFPVDI